MAKTTNKFMVEFGKYVDERVLKLKARYRRFMKSAGISKHQASKKGHKHNHQPSLGEKHHQEFLMKQRAEKVQQ